MTQNCEKIRNKIAYSKILNVINIKIKKFIV